MSHPACVSIKREGYGLWWPLVWIAWWAKCARLRRGHQLGWVHHACSWPTMVYKHRVQLDLNFALLLSHPCSSSSSMQYQTLALHGSIIGYLYMWTLSSSLHLVPHLVAPEYTSHPFISLSFLLIYFLFWICIDGVFISGLVTSSLCFNQRGGCGLRWLYVWIAWWAKCPRLRREHQCGSIMLVAGQQW